MQTGFSTQPEGLHAETARENKKRVEFHKVEWFTFISLALFPVGIPFFLYQQAELAGEKKE